MASLWAPTYLKDMVAYSQNRNVPMYGRWDNPPSANEGGVDLASPGGTPVYALADGTIVGIGNFWHSKTIYVPNSGPPGYGVVTTRVNIPGYGLNDLYYQHIQLEPGLKKGDTVHRGQQLGTIIGSVGELEMGLNADWGGIWGVNHPAAWATDPRPQILALMGLGTPSDSTAQGQNLTLRAFCDQVLIDLRGNAGGGINITNFMISWCHLEGGGQTNQCKWNPLNTMQDETGAVQCPGTLPGIKMYPDDATGIKATEDALKNGRYPALLHALSTGDENGLGFNNNPMAADIAGDLTMWVHGVRSPLAEDYILNIMSGAGIPGARITGGTRNGGNAASQSQIDAWGNTSLGIDTKGVTVGGAADNLANLNSFFGNVNQFFSDPVRLVKIVAGAAMVVAGLALVIKQFSGPVMKAAAKIGIGA